MVMPPDVCHPDQSRSGIRLEISLDSFLRDALALFVFWVAALTLTQSLEDKTAKRWFDNIARDPY